MVKEKKDQAWSGNSTWMKRGKRYQIGLEKLWKMDKRKAEGKDKEEAI